MKTFKFKTLVAAGLWVLLGLGCFSGRANFEISAEISVQAPTDFIAPLTPLGGWIEVRGHGRCWRPHVAADWRPYCEGSWVWTDNGWYWQTDEAWGWACYHYGSWIYDPSLSWVWIPDVEWAPAWVSWRHGGGYVGWAPLGPGHVVFEGPQFTFVSEGRFHEPIRRSSVVVNNTTIINNTTVINNIRQENRGSQKVFVNEGPGLATMQRATGNKVRTVPIATAVERTPVPAEVRRSRGENRNQPRPVSTEPNKQTTAPTRQTAEPRSQTAEPTRQATEPQRQTTDPNKQTSEPTRRTAQPRSQTTEPTQRIADPRRQTVAPPTVAPPAVRPNEEEKRIQPKTSVAPEPVRATEPPVEHVTPKRQESRSVPEARPVQEKPAPVEKFQAEERTTRPEKFTPEEKPSRPKQVAPAPSRPVAPREHPIAPEKQEKKKPEGQP